MSNEFIRQEDIVSKHYLRRTARRKERWMTRAGMRVRVVKAQRGPARYYVVWQRDG